MRDSNYLLEIAAILREFHTLLLWLWLGSAICAAIVGGRREAWHAGGVLGLLFGPIGLIAAFGLDGRRCCPKCHGRIDGVPELCPHCRSQIAVKPEVEAPEERPHVSRLNTARLRPGAVVKPAKELPDFVEVEPRGIPDPPPPPVAKKPAWGETPPDVGRRPSTLKQLR